jgi:hypothetical protein
MALRAVTDHPKFARLKRLLKASKCPALGYLEGLWHFAGKYTPHGDLGKYSDDDIEAWLEWEGEPGALVAALRDAGWLDASKDHRIVVHDWHIHADDATKLAVKRSGRDFVTKPATLSPQRSDNVVNMPTVSGLPEPEPEPVPEPAPEPEPVPEPESAAAPSGTAPACSPNELIYDAYPRKVAKAEALKAIGKAVDRLGKGESPMPPMTPPEARVFLAEQARTYATSPAGTKPPPGQDDFRPHPATWFNGSRYLDDIGEWQRGRNTGSGNFTQQNRAQERTNRNIDAMRRAAEAIVDSASPRVSG